MSAETQQWQPSQEQPQEQSQGWKARIEAVLEGTHPRCGRAIVFFLQALIISSVLSIGLDTLPNLPAWAKKALALEEIFVVAVFTLEYILRIVIARRPLGYIFSFWGAVDLLAVLPFYFSLGVDMRSARAFRLLRLLRLLKLAHYSNASDRIQSAMKLVGGELLVFGFVALIVLYLCAIGIYYFENAAQPEVFASVFHSMWWAAVTLTTVGYGDVVPVTLGGRVFTIAVLILALGIVAMPTGLIASALNRVREEERKSRRGDQ